MSTLSWQAGNASGSLLVGTIIQALIEINHPSYEWQNWHGTLLVFASVLIIYIVNVWGAQVWPKVQNGLLLLHIIAFAVVISVLWAMSPHRSAKEVFTNFEDRGGWGNVPLSTMAGQVTAIYSLLGNRRCSVFSTVTKIQQQGPTQQHTWLKKSATHRAMFRSRYFGHTL